MLPDHVLLPCNARGLPSLMQLRYRQPDGTVMGEGVGEAEGDGEGEGEGEALLEEYIDRLHAPLMAQRTQCILRQAYDLPASTLSP